MTEQPDEATQTEDAPATSPQLSNNLAVPDRPAWIISVRRGGAVAEARARLAELAAHPVVVATATATATVGTGVAVSLLRHAMRSSAASQSPAAAPLALTYHIVQHVHVVHHVVHHVVRPVFPPGSGVYPPR